MIKNFGQNSIDKLTRVFTKQIRFVLCGIFFSLCATGFNYAQTKTPVPFGPVPNKNQMRWQEMEYYAFVQFSLNTYTNQSWAYGN